MQKQHWQTSANIQVEHLPGGSNILPHHPSNVQKIARHTNTLTPSVLELTKNNIFFRPEEAMLETGESLSQLLKIKFCLREILNLHSSKQNEKHRYTTDICSNITSCNTHSLTYSLFLVIFIFSYNQHWVVLYHLFLHWSCTEMYLLLFPYNKFVEC